MATSQNLVNADLNLATLDGVVNSNSETELNRLGRPNLTLKGFENRANAKIDALGFTRLEGVTFETGATVPDNRSLLLWATADGGTGFYYYFSGEIPSGGKIVPPGSTPASAGGTGYGVWLVIDDLEARLGAEGSQVPINTVSAARLSSENNPLVFFSFAADGITNDTSSFASLESAYAGRDVDLLGKVYFVDKYFTGCNYTNGFFRVAESSIPATNFSVGKELYPSTESRNLSDFTLKARSADSRYAVTSGIRGAVVILGDSISHGAFQGELYKDGWVNVFKRMSNAQTESKSYGFAPLFTLTTGSPISREVHDVNFSVGNAFVFQESTTGGADVLQGLAAQSSQAGDSINISCPTFQQKVRIWFIRSTSGGVFSYSFNGGASTNVDTSGATDLAASIVVDMLDNKKGVCNLTLTVVSGTVRFTGVGYECPLDDGSAGNAVQNFSQSGRRLRVATEQMIDAACQGSVLMLCLGHNDQADIAADPSLAANFTQRIDWVIRYCLKYNTSLVVPDFCWVSAPGDYVRKELRRAAAATKGLYIPLPDYLYRDQMLKTEYSAGFYQINTLGFFVDVSHPTAAGAKWMAESISKAIGLSVNSKKEAFSNHDFAWPLLFDPSSPFENNFPTYPNISFVKRSGDNITVSARLKNTPGTALAAGTYPVNLPYNTTNSRQIQFTTTVPFDTPNPMGLTNTDAVFFAVVCGQQVGMTLRSVTPYISTFNYSLTLPLF